MFYRQFLKIIDELNPNFVEKFDYWLATLPINNQRNITVSIVSSQLGVKYESAEYILKFAEKQGILEQYYLVKCPDCNYNLAKIEKKEIPEMLMNFVYCDECESDKHITLEDIYTAFKVIKEPDVDEEEIEKEINNKIQQVEEINVNFSKADSLLNDINTLYEAFYNPSESAYKKLNDLKSKLDLDYGKDTTAKGKALEVLICELFNQIKGVSCTNDVRTETNQFDCTGLSEIKTVTHSIFSYFTPYFIIECKNEPKKSPDNNYYNKLLSIMDTNEAQLGIIWGRKDATKTYYSISREHYLKHMGERKQQIIITCSDKDLEYLIDKKVNLLKYLFFKIFQVTTNSFNSTYEMFDLN